MGPCLKYIRSILLIINFTHEYYCTTMGVETGTEIKALLSWVAHVFDMSLLMPVSVQINNSDDKKSWF